MSFKQFIADIQKMVGSSAQLRISTPTDSKKSWASVVSPESQLFTEFPYFLGDAHEPFAITLEALSSVATTTSDKTVLSVVDDTLHITTGSRHHVELAVSQSTDSLLEKPIMENPTLSLDISQDFLDLFRATLPVLGIEKIHAAQADFRLYVRFSKKIFIAVYSPMQVVAASIPNSLSLSGEFNVPYPTFLSLIKSLPKSGCTISFSEDSILVSDKSYTLLTLVAPLSPRDPPGPQVLETTTNLVKAFSESISFPKSELEVFLTSSKGVIPEDTPVRFVPSGSSIRLEAANTTSKSSFKIKGAVVNSESPFSLELKFLKNILAKSGDTISLCVSHGVMIMKSGSVTLITTTYADDGEGSSYE